LNQQGCFIVGAGPAGVMLGLLLARAGVIVTVIEKHDAFLRDFHGDTIHPPTLEVVFELGLLDEFLPCLINELLPSTPISTVELRRSQTSAVFRRASSSLPSCHSGTLSNSLPERPQHIPAFAFVIAVR